MKLDFSDPNPEVTDAYFNGVEAGHSARDGEIDELAGQVFELKEENRILAKRIDAHIERAAPVATEAGA